MKTDIGDFDMVSDKPRAAEFDAGLEHILKDVMRFSLDDPVPLAIYHHAGVSTWQQFTYIDEDDVDDAVYPGADGVSTKHLTRFEQKLLRWMIGYVRENIDADQPGSELPAFYSEDGFKEYSRKRRKLQQTKKRFRGGTTTGGGGGTDRDQEISLKCIEAHILDIASKVKKMTRELLAKHKERMQKEQQAAKPHHENHQDTGAKA